jgi:predicted dehydrogenase
MSGHVNRREFLKHTALVAGAAAASWPSASRGQVATQAPARKLNVACIGVGGRGGDDMEEAFKAGANVVGLCDIDGHALANAAKKHPEAKTYRDYRKMLEEMNKDIEAVTVGTPDHHHFPASMMAIKLGKHVYCEKPLTHSVWEARQLAEAARKAGVATQMGTQGHAGEPIRLLTEWIAAGAIGQVREVHIWTDRPAGWWPQGVDRPKETPECPAHIDWELWLGPAPQRPYHPAYHPFKWRGWWDFGTGALGDIGCHAMDLPWTALKLTAPTSVMAYSTGNKPETGPLWSDIVYEFPARPGMSAVKLWWYDGRNKKTGGGSSEYKAIAMLKELAGVEEKAELPEGGQIFIGDNGTIHLSGGGPRLVPESRMKDFVRPEKTLPRNTLGHHGEWLEACRGGKAAGSNFDYAGPLAEAVLLGNISIRLGKKIEWDSKNLKATNAPEAEGLIRREYRKGWEV